MTQALLLKDIQSATGAQIIVFSSEHSPEIVLENLRDNYQVRAVLGVYKGTRELSYVASIDALPRVFNQGLIDNQESLLLLSNEQKTGNRLAYLWYPEDNRFEALGELFRITKEEAENARAYTYMADTGYYYGTRPMVPEQATG